MAIVIIAPGTMLPEALHHVRLVLIVLRVTVLRGIIAYHLSIDDIPATLHYHTTALEVLRTSVLFLILALRLCAYLNNCN